jgi:Tfp pilus assembly protein PilO
MNEEMNENFDNEQETVVVRKEDLKFSNKPRRKIQTGMFGIPEFIALGFGLFALLGVLLFYFFFVTPARAELKRHKDDRDRLEKELKDADSKFGNITSTEAKVSELINSVDSFERNYLPFANVGKAGLYQRLNNLISGYGLTNVAGPDYAPLEIEQRTNVQNEKESGREKFKSLFPGVYISMTLEGEYQNIRRFIREIESSNQFVVVSTVELEGADAKEKREQKQIQRQATQTNQLRPNISQPTMEGFPVNPNANPIAVNPLQPKTQSQPKAAPPKGKVRGELVSLRIEMAAYFRRNNIPNAVNLEVKQ